MVGNLDVNGKVYYYTGDGKVAYPAGAWKRAFARFLDGILSSIPSIIFLLVYQFAYFDNLFMESVFSPSPYHWSFVLAQVFAILSPLIIFILIPTIKEGQTPMKILFKMQPMFLDNTSTFKGIAVRELFITTFLVVLPLTILIGGVYDTIAWQGYNNFIYLVNSSFYELLPLILEDAQSVIDSNTTNFFDKTSIDSFVLFLTSNTSSTDLSNAMEMIKEIEWTVELSNEFLQHLSNIYINTLNNSSDSLVFLDNDQIEAMNYFVKMIPPIGSDGGLNSEIFGSSSPLFYIGSSNQSELNSSYSDYVYASLDTLELSVSSNYNIILYFNSDMLSVSWFLTDGWFSLANSVTPGSISDFQIAAAYAGWIMNYIYSIWMIVLWISIGFNKGKIGLHDKVAKTIIIDKQRIYEPTTEKNGSNPNEMILNPSSKNTLPTVKPTSVENKKEKISSDLSIENEDKESKVTKENTSKEKIKKIEKSSLEISDIFKNLDSLDNDKSSELNLKDTKNKDTKSKNKSPSSKKNTTTLKKEVKKTSTKKQSPNIKKKEEITKKEPKKTSTKKESKNNSKVN